jgi:hypothetical protein
MRESIPRWYSDLSGNELSVEEVVHIRVSSPASDKVQVFDLGPEEAAKVLKPLEGKGTEQTKRGRKAGTTDDDEPDDEE